MEQLSAPLLDIVLSGGTRDGKRQERLTLGLSALIHGLFLAMILISVQVPSSRQSDDDPPSVTVELTPSEPSPKPSLSPSPAPADTGTRTATEGTAPQPLPQLQDGKLADHSTPPPKEQPNLSLSPPPPAKPTKQEKPKPVTQTDRDMVLTQILRHWQPPKELARDDKANIRVGVTVRADGYLDGEYDARRPWSPAAVFDGYGKLTPNSVERRTVDAFLTAIRQAQPLRLPPELKAKAPFTVRLDFRFKDAR